MVMFLEDTEYLLKLLELESSAAQPTYAQVPTLSPTLGSTAAAPVSGMILFKGGCVAQIC